MRCCCWMILPVLCLSLSNICQANFRCVFNLIGLTLCSLHGKIISLSSQWSSLVQKLDLCDLINIKLSRKRRINSARIGWWHCKHFIQSPKQSNGMCCIRFRYVSGSYFKSDWPSRWLQVEDKHLFPVCINLLFHRTWTWSEENPNF